MRAPKHRIIICLRLIALLDSRCGSQNGCALPRLNSGLSSRAATLWILQRSWAGFGCNEHVFWQLQCVTS